MNIWFYLIKKKEKKKASNLLFALNLHVDEITISRIVLFQQMFICSTLTSEEDDIKISR